MNNNPVETKEESEHGAAWGVVDFNRACLCRVRHNSQALRDAGAKLMNALEKTKCPLAYRDVIESAIRHVAEVANTKHRLIGSRSIAYLAALIEDAEQESEGL